MSINQGCGLLRRCRSLSCTGSVICSEPKRKTNLFKSGQCLDSSQTELRGGKRSTKQHEPSVLQVFYNCAKEIERKLEKLPLFTKLVQPLHSYRQRPMLQAWPGSIFFPTSGSLEKEMEDWLYRVRPRIRLIEGSESTVTISLPISAEFWIWCS